jgi:hypothetical protein
LGRSVGETERTDLLERCRLSTRDRTGGKAVQMNSSGLDWMISKGTHKLETKSTTNDRSRGRQDNSPFGFRAGFRACGHRLGKTRVRAGDKGRWIQRFSKTKLLEMEIIHQDRTEETPRRAGLPYSGVRRVQSLPTPRRKIHEIEFTVRRFSPCGTHTALPSHLIREREI